MSNSELDKLLKAARVPGRAPEFWEDLPKRISARLHWQSKRDKTLQGNSRRHVRLAWTLGTVAVSIIVSLMFLTARKPADSPSNGQMARAEKCFREVESLFPNQVEAIIFDEHGPRLVLADTADVPRSTPLYLKICGPSGCREVVTFSGQQIRVNGEKCDVLADGDGNVLVVGKDVVWSSASRSEEVGRYHIKAQPLGMSS